MTTDINELARRVERIISDVKLKHGGNDTYAPVMKWDEFLALVEALEKAQRANAAQDDHINQQQDRIESLEKKNAELGKYAGELESFRTAYMEWSDKTDWVQKDKRFDFLKPWGKHRADVLKEYIQHLESRTVKLPEPFELAKVSGGLSYYYADEVDAALIVAGIKVEAE